MAEPEKRPWWSVRISGVLRLLLIVYGVLGLPLLVGYGVSFVSHRWMTQNEKRAATKALRSVEDLKNSTGVGDNVWKIKDQRAEQLVERAQEVAFTEKDHEMGEGVSTLLLIVESDYTLHDFPKTKGQIAKRFPDTHLPSGGVEVQNEAEVRTFADDFQIDLDSRLRSELGLYGPGGKKK